VLHYSYKNETTLLYPTRQVTYTTGYPTFFKEKNILTLSYVRKYFKKNIYAYKRGEIWFENA
jgi:hypothetical protein